jgi:hypothetical protein
MERRGGILGGKRRGAWFVALGLVAACSSSYSVATSDGGAPSDDAGNTTTTMTKDASTGVDAKSATDAGSQPDAPVVDAGPIDASKPCTADTGVDPENCGVCGRVCNSAAGCVAGECQHVVFVTQTPNGTPAFGGIAGGDAICQAAAADGGLHGPFLAWLGTPAADPSKRFVQGTREYVLPLGTIVALNWSDLTAGGLKHGIDADQHGANPPIPHAWTNVNSNGTYNMGNGMACGSWTTTADNGVVGNVGGSGSGWSSSNSTNCMNTGYGLYCMEQ